MKEYPGFDITPVKSPMGFRYGKRVFGPQVEMRYLDAIRPSLINPECEGPEEVYAIAMDVGNETDRMAITERHLLFGVVTYAAGRLGDEPIRSQGHIHRVSPLSGWSTPEIYEIWDGEAIVYMQERAEDDPGRCFAVYAKPGDVVIVPPYWVHATISANPAKPLTFGAWCDRAYGFEYDGIRKYKGIAWFPILNKEAKILWRRNVEYEESELICKKPGDYSRLGIVSDKSIYRIFEANPDTFNYVPFPNLKKDVWENFIP